MHDTIEPGDIVSVSCINGVGREECINGKVVLLPLLHRPYWLIKDRRGCVHAIYNYCRVTRWNAADTERLRPQFDTDTNTEE